MKKLYFENDKFDVAIVLNGKLPDDSFFEKTEDLIFVAADGAANNLLRIGKEPDFIIGDMDSFIINTILEKAKMIRYDDQDTNDFEKTLIWSIERNIKNILIIGFHGGELEHTLNNFSVLVKYSQQINLCILDEKRYGIPIAIPVQFKINMGEIVSLIPSPTVNLTSRGLKWELSKETLEIGKREGARNLSNSENVELEIHSGSCILFVDDRFPLVPHIS